MGEWLTEALPGLLVLLYALMHLRHWLVVLGYRAEVRRLEKALGGRRGPCSTG
jgi:hypothetical protein